VVRDRRSDVRARDLSLRAALLALTVTTGFVDGVSYLGLGHVFTANMTGNVVLLGFGIAGARGLPVLAPIVSLLAFLAGAGAAGSAAARLATQRERLFAVGIATEAAFLAGATVLAAAAAVRVGSAAGYATIGLLGIGMGVRNATVRKLAVPDLTTTVLTLTITALAAEFSRGAGRSATARRGAAVLAMFAGAVLGALLVKHSLVAPLAIAAGVDLLAVAGVLAR
jgi:uncharacterized membrane protein YoaK (UPF0700 family)